MFYRYLNSVATCSSVSSATNILGLTGYVTMFDIIWTNRICH